MEHQQLVGWADDAQDAVTHVAETFRRERPARREETDVNWPRLFGTVREPAVSRPSLAPESQAAQWLRMLTVWDELSRVGDTSTVLRRSVEALRRDAGLERAAVFLLTADQQRLKGTWGTDANGETVDEFDLTFDVGKSHTEAFARAEAGLGRWLILEGVPLLTSDGGRRRVLGHGWNGLIPLRTGAVTLGLVACDAALSGAAPDPLSLAMSATFCSLLAARGVLADSPDVVSEAIHRGASAAEGTVSPSTVLALRLLERDLDLSRSEVARRAGVTPSRLGRQFVKDMGETLADYKNRLRLERVLRLLEVEPQNLLRAALEAGFGSYAQFHRVFRANAGTSPKDYVARRLADACPPARPRPKRP